MEGEGFSELGRVQAIEKLLESAGFGAAKAPGSRLAHKVLLEGIDFNLVYFPLKHLGYKAVVEVAGELEAGLSEPRSLSVVMGVSAKLDYPQIKQIWDGMCAAAREFGFADVQLDLQPSRNGLALSLSATAEPSAEFGSPASKDLICVSGPLGAAYLGQRLLESKLGGKEDPSKDLERYKMIVGACLRPDVPSGMARKFAQSGLKPTGGYFVGRGLADAVLRLSRDSGLGAKVYADKIPFEGGSFDLGRELDVDPVSAAMNGGDDCRLLFTVPIADAERFRRDFQTFDIIGHLALSEAGCVMVTPDGVELPLSAQGW